MTGQHQFDQTSVAVVITAAMALFGATSGGRAQTQAPPAPPAVAPLADIKLPPGFRISVFASGLQGARFMAVSPDGVLLVARRRTHEVVALPDANKDGVAEPVVVLRGFNRDGSGAGAYATLSDDNQDFIYRIVHQ
jgi:glucose/arabinose dehydrogenase